MGSSKINFKGQRQGRVTSAFMCFLKKNNNNKNKTNQHGLLDLDYRCVYISQYIYIYIANYICKQIHQGKKSEILYSFIETCFHTNENPYDIYNIYVWGVCGGVCVYVQLYMYMYSILYTYMYTVRMHCIDICFHLRRLSYIS